MTHMFDGEYCIVLRSKYTGELIHLGSKYANREDAQAAVDRDEFCDRCNGIILQPLYHKDMQWVDKHRGFQTPDQRKDLLDPLV